MSDETQVEEPLSGSQIFEAGFLDLTHQGTLKRLEALAVFMDSAVTIPGTSRRVGADAILSFVPGVGSLAGTAISLYLMAEAWRIGAPPPVLLRMAGHVAIDTAVGAIPLAGPFFDLFYKANSKNLALLKTHLGDNRT